MIIDLSRTIIRKNLASLISTVVVTLVIIILLVTPLDNIFNDIENSLLAIFLAAAYVIYVIYISFRNYNYIYYNDETEKLILRYFSPNIFSEKKNSIEFPKQEFADYKLNSFFMRYREQIILFRKTKKGLANYPPVSITALSISERERLLRSLNELKLRNK
jgi:hypothetical protein